MPPSLDASVPRSSETAARRELLYASDRNQAASVLDACQVHVAKVVLERQLGGLRASDLHVSLR